MTNWTATYGVPVALWPTKCQWRHEFPGFKWNLGMAWKDLELSYVWASPIMKHIPSQTWCVMSSLKKVTTEKIGVSCQSMPKQCLSVCPGSSLNLGCRELEIGASDGAAQAKRERGSSSSGQRWSGEVFQKHESQTTSLLRAPSRDAQNVPVPYGCKNPWIRLRPWMVYSDCEAWRAQGIVRCSMQKNDAWTLQGQWILLFLVPQLH